MNEPEIPGVQMNLSRDEAIVLFEFLSRYTDTARLSIEDQAEQRVLWDLCCILESQLHEPISPHYEQVLERSREVVRDRIE
jgi:hypothetical protein